MTRASVNNQAAVRAGRIGIAIGIGLTLLVLGLFQLGAFEWLELRSYVLWHALLPRQTLDTRVLLIRIDDESAARLQVRPTAIPRRMYAAAVRHLADAGAGIVAFDVVFARSEDPIQDADLADAIAEAGNVVLSRYIGVEKHEKPLPLFRKGELGEALINFRLDRDNLLRDVHLVSMDLSGGAQEPETVLTLSLEVARLFLDPSGGQELDLDDPSELGLGTLRVPSPDGRMRVHYYGPPGTFPHISFWRAVRGDLAPDAVRGKIALIGGAAPTLHDTYLTPFTEKWVQTLAGPSAEKQTVRMDGMEIHANAIQTILDRSFIHGSRDRWWLVPGLLVGLGALGTALLLWSRNRPRTVALLWGVLLVGILAAGYGFFRWRWYWLDVVPLAMLVVAQASAGMAYQRYLESQKRRVVQQMFGRYVSPQVVEHLIRNPDMANPSGRKERLTVFFSDLRGFTALSESMEPQEVQRFLNEYFTAMTRILFKHRGTLDKFMGDAIMAFFGNPEPQPDHARRAVRMAIEMQEVVARLNQTWSAVARPTIGVGMGIHTGEVTVGNLGSEQFLDYTVIGDTVNLACRLQEHAKAGEILIAQATYDEVKGTVEAERLEPIRVKGKSEPVAVYRVMSGGAGIAGHLT
ncbi:MAG: CHASE2 domain-containing protein [Nitrospiraceae bacterium]